GVVAISFSQPITQLLLAWRRGDKTALDQLIPRVEAELRRMARHYMAGEQRRHTLQTTALVNEAYLRLVASDRVNWPNPAHFFAVSAQLMRRILVDYARSRRYPKRGGGARLITLDEELMGSRDAGRDLIALDDALEGLAKVDPRKSKVVELRVFGGMTVK